MLSPVVVHFSGVGSLCCKMRYLFHLLGLRVDTRAVEWISATLNLFCVFETGGR